MRCVLSPTSNSCQAFQTFRHAVEGCGLPTSPPFPHSCLPHGFAHAQALEASTQLTRLHIIQTRSQDQVALLPDDLIFPAYHDLQHVAKLTSLQVTWGLCMYMVPYSQHLHGV